MKSKITKFLFTTFLISWISWGSLVLLSHYGILKYGEGIFMILFIIGGNGPFIASFIVKKLNKNKEEYKDFKKRLLKWKVNPLWYIGLMVGPLLLFIMLSSIYSFKNGEPVNLFQDKVYLIFILIWINIVGGGLEEVGWRGVLLPDLMEKYSKIKSTIITSLVWAAWHIPLWFIDGASQQSMSFISFTLMAIGFSFLLTTFYVRTKSILICVLLHSMINSSMAIISRPFLTTYFEPVLFIVICFVIYMLLAERNSVKKEVSV